MRRVLLLAFVASALVSAPAARLVAMAPCGGGAPMDCCAGPADRGAPPCHCSLKPVVPAPAALDAAHAPVAVLAEAPLPAVEADTPAEALAPAPVAPRARAAPLFLLFSTLLV